MPHIAIIGAGIRGLSSAAWLDSAGAMVTIFEKHGCLGGVWQQVHGEARINTPSYGYTFHPTNHWTSNKPSAAEILQNLEKMVQACELQPHIRYSTPVDKVRQKGNGHWQINGGKQEFDGVLLCTGFLGKAKMPPSGLVADFEGVLRHAYDVSPEDLQGRNVLVVGSGPSALDMLALARNSHCRSAALSIHKNVGIRDISRWETVKHAIASNPLIYRLTKRPGGQPAAVRHGIREIIADPVIQIRRDELKRISRNTATFEGASLPVDIIVWCTGWETGTPGWAGEFRENPSLVVAACPKCLDTTGFGFGTATAHAKALLATLEHNLTQKFQSGSSKCPCESEHTRFGQHILLSLALFFVSQPGGWSILARHLRQGFQSNLIRFRDTEENKFASLLAFFNAPFGF